MSPRKYSDEERLLLNKANQFIPEGDFGNGVNFTFMDRNIIIARGKGSQVWDHSGNQYVDYLLGSGPMLIGHAHPEVVDAVKNQLDSGTTYFTLNENAILLAEEIVKAVPCAEKVRFLTSGTEATLYAMRLARAYRKREKILKFEGGYHGMNAYALMSSTSSNPLDFPNPTSDSSGIPISVQSDTLVAPFNDLEITSAIIEKHHDEIGGVIVEPFQRVIPPKPGFLEGLREVTKHYEIPLIFDEIVTGFRFAYGGAQEYYGVTPDVATLGKTVAGGFALSAVVGSEEIMDHFDSTKVSKEDYVKQVGTLSGNPIASIAGLATLKVLRREGTYDRLFAMGNKLKDALQTFLDQAEIPAQVIGEPPLFDVFFINEKIVDYRTTLKNDKAKMARFNQVLLDNGILKSDVKSYVSTVHTKDDIQSTIQAYKTAIDILANE